MKNLKLIESDLFDIRLKTVHVIERSANIQRVLAGDWDYLSPFQVDVIERLFGDVEELKDMLKVIKNRQVRNSVTTCFDETEAA
jgi:hypothetical protein